VPEPSGDTAEQNIKESKLALRSTRLCCHASHRKSVQLQPFALTYWRNLLRSLALTAVWPRRSIFHAARAIRECRISFAKGELIRGIPEQVCGTAGRCPARATKAATRGGT
jgi:hypothetical protein